MKSNAGAPVAPEQQNAFSATKFARKLARKKRKNPRVKVRQCLNAKWFDALINLSILWALFSEDIRVLAMPKQADVVVWSIHIVVMALFLLELVLRSYSQRGFFLSFYFFLDMVASLTMIADFLPLIQGEAEGGDSAGSIRAAKAARVGARAARLVRVLRIIRVIKLFISARKKRAKDTEEEEVVEDEGAPSELSKALQGTLAKRTIIFVLVLLAAQVVIDYIPHSLIYEQIYDNRVHASLAQLYSATYNSSTGWNITGEPWVSLVQEVQTVIQKPILSTTPLIPSFNLALHRIDIFKYGPNADQEYTFWPIPSCNDPPCGNPKYNPNAAGDDPMTTWLPAWPRPDDHFPNCKYLSLATILDSYDPSVARDCPDVSNAEGLQSLRSLRTIGPSELLPEPFIVDGDPHPHPPPPNGCRSSSLSTVTRAQPWKPRPEPGAEPRPEAVPEPTAEPKPTAG